MTRKPAPVETKVTAASVTSAIVAMAMLALGRVLPIDALPPVVQGILLTIVTGAATGAVTWAAGYLAPHTPRGPARTVLLERLDQLLDAGVRALERHAQPADVDGRHERKPDLPEPTLPDPGHDPEPRRRRGDRGATDAQQVLSVAIILTLAAVLIIVAV